MFQEWIEIEVGKQAGLREELSSALKAPPMVEVAQPTVTVEEQPGITTRSPPPPSQPDPVVSRPVTRAS